MDSKVVRDYFAQEGVVDYYSHASTQVGLWLSEEKVLTQLFRQDQTLLELGCGTGRIALGLAELGYNRLLGVDFSREMILRARQMNTLLGEGVSFQVADVTALPFGENEFEGAIFGFNGLMQVTSAEKRLQALQEIYRVLQPKAYLVFTTHDRSESSYKEFWEAEARRWQEGAQNPRLAEFGDRLEGTDLGELFIHVPTREAVLSLIHHAGFRHDSDAMRSEIANESQEVRDFSDDCRFWIVQKP